MERILVVDDEASIRKALQIGLASENFEIDLARDGGTGIQMGQQKAYDILIADLCLPDMTGLDVIKNIKATSPTVIPIVITGKGSMQSSLEAIRLEVSDYLEKPLSLASVKASIARGLERRSIKRRQTEEQAREKLVMDSLTGLPDRSQFMERLTLAMTESSRDEERSLAVLLIDIDRFKSINDTHGHMVGDGVLIELARRMKGCITANDSAARLNGDTFAVLLADVQSEAQVLACAQHYQHTAEQPMIIEGAKVSPGISIGIVIKRNFFNSSDDVLRDAEMALACCKERGGGQVQVFDKAMLEQAVAALQFENELRLGIQNQEFVLHYQPIIRLDDRQLDGFEALIRWHHPERGLLDPPEFIAKAEELGLINQIGNWVLREVGRQLKTWQAEVPGFDKVTVNVNIAVCQFLQPGFIDFLKEILDDNDLAPSNLRLELTESVLMEDSARSIDILESIKAIGIKLAIDDFGTGYSALSYLQQFPLDDLKIGESFVHKLSVNAECYEIVKTIVDLSKKLGLNVVAEGVETEHQLDKVKRLGIDMVQGFYFACPADNEAVIDVIKPFQ
jgi:Amt family ammonium transporter